MNITRNLKPATVAEIRSLAGDLDDEVVLAIRRTKATASEIMQALKPTAGGGYWNCISHAGGQLLSPTVRAVRDILSTSDDGS